MEVTLRRGENSDAAEDLALQPISRETWKNLCMLKCQRSKVIMSRLMENFRKATITK